MSKFGNECKKYEPFSLYTKINCKEAQEQVGRVMKLQGDLDGFFAKTTDKFDCKVIDFDKHNMNDIEHNELDIDKIKISLSQKYKEVYNLKEKIDFIIPKLDKIQNVININYELNISEVESRLDNLITVNTQLKKIDIHKNYQSIYSYEKLNEILSNINK
ncbi:hypothetical protein [uncultured Veillonella sp.]|uniref:hypothetical protein n=1 Tax=uncultured Veillonella sp. TaxID=159268 RepID=UPI0025E74ED3|nr:hypothetical protein [uncultured Veillonella sp.]